MLREKRGRSNVKIYLLRLSRFIYTLPERFTPQEAAPLMCAGLTVFTALHIAQVPPTAHVAIVGIGGLGHIGLQFARAWGCHVTAISHTSVSF